MVSWTKNRNIIQSIAIQEYHREQKQANILMCNNITLKYNNYEAICSTSPKKKAELLFSTKIAIRNFTEACEIT